MHYPAFSTSSGTVPHDNGIGNDRELFAIMDLVDDAVGGQFSLYFCSTACLRAFFNSLVDELEKRIQQDKKREERLEREEKIDGLPKSVKKELDEMVKRGELEVRPKSRRARSPRKQP